MKYKLLLIFGFCILCFYTFSFAQKSYLVPAFNDYSDIIFDAHIKIGEHSSGYSDFERIIDMIKDLKKYNTVDFFESNNNHLVSVFGLLTPELLLKEARNTYSRIVSKLGSLKFKELSCWEKKKNFDKRFFWSLENYSANPMQFYMDEAVKYEYCATQARVHYNAYDALRKRLNYYTILFDKSYRNWGNQNIQFMNKQYR